MSNNLHRHVSFGLFDFDAVSGELRRDGVVVKLAPQPARVLALLVSRPAEVVLREEFRRELWGDDTFVDFERGLNFCVTQVRAALGDSSDNPRFVQTVPRRGYRFIAPVTPRCVPRWEGQTPAGGTVPTVGDSPRRQSAGPGTVPGGLGLGGTTEGARANGAVPRRWRYAVVAAVLAAATIAWWTLGAPRSATFATTSAPTRVVVLPIVNLTGDASLDYVADALTDEVIAQLGTLSRERVAVIARTSAMRYRDAKKTVEDIGRELEVRYVVESSLRGVGNALRITSSVIPVHDQAARTWWDDVFETTANTDSQQTHAAIRVARHVAAELLRDRHQPPETITTASAHAWNAYLQASALMNAGTPQDVTRAVSHLEDAVQHDPTFGTAWARIVEARHVLVMMGAAPPRQAYPLAQQAAARALATAPELSATHVAQGLLHLWYNWRPDDAARSFERALALNPSSASAHHDYAWALVALGRTDEAIRHMLQARDLDPLSSRANTDVGWLHLQLRQPAEAAKACQHTLAIDSRALEAQACLERAYTQRQLLDAALDAARATLRTQDVGHARRGSSPAESLREIWTWRLQQLEAAAKSRWVSPYTLAVYYVLTGDHDRALSMLEAAYDERVGMMVFLARDPALDPLRTNPRFATLLQKVNERRF